MKRKWSHNPDAHRKLLMTAHFDNPQLGDDVKELQKAINKRIANLKLPVKKVKVDGKCGRQTVAKSHQVARHLGVGVNGDGVPIYVQKKIRHPETRTKAQIKRGQEYREDHKPADLKVVGNKVIGNGTAGEKFCAAMTETMRLYYNGTSHRFYSQSGVTQFALGITGEHPGQRSDCSQGMCSMTYSAGLEDPCGSDYDPAQAHYTGSIYKKGKFVPISELRHPAIILYGKSPTFHHVEGWYGNGDGKTPYKDLSEETRDVTCGHGSPPFDKGYIGMIADAHAVNLDI